MRIRSLFFSLCLFVFTCCGIQGDVFAQSATNPDGNILMSKSWSAYATLHTQGFGFGYRNGKYIDGYRLRFFEGSLVSMTHPKEVRSSNPFFPTAQSYVYGKLNYVYIPRLSYGIQRTLNDEPYWGGVEVSYSYKAGASLAITKPVYLLVLNYVSDPFNYKLTEERYDPDEHFPEIIYGRGPFLKGFDEIGFYPGLHAQAALNFEYGEYDESLKALEAGLSVDLFPRPIPIMAFSDKSWYMLSLYISLHLGKRSY